MKNEETEHGKHFGQFLTLFYYLMTGYYLNWSPFPPGDNLDANFVIQQQIQISKRSGKEKSNQSRRLGDSMTWKLLHPALQKEWIAAEV